MSATYLNEPSHVAINRIRFDEKQISTDKDMLAKEGMYFKFNINNEINTIYHKLLIGPDDTPYQKGFYLFEGQFPDNYPFKPMTMRTITQGSDDGNKTGIRKHPNLYICGKCCFSFLGTWAGPPWTACNNAKSVAISMRSVMTKFPLENEPGYEREERNKVNGIFKRQDLHNEYAALISWFNIKHAVCGVINKIDEVPYKYFKTEILAEFNENYQYYIDTAQSMLKLDGTTVKSRVWQFIVKYNVYEVISTLKSLGEKYCKICHSVSETVVAIEKDPVVVVNITTESQITPIQSPYNVAPLDPPSPKYDIPSTVCTTTSNVKTSKVKTRSVPNGSATSFDVGFIKISENDGNKYQVSDKKRWKRYYT
jgi:ubiquitin-protein ligase